jgi:hypothetical protein
MTTTASELVFQAPTNPVHNTGYRTQTDKAWARSYRPIQNLMVHTFVDNNGRSTTGSTTDCPCGSRGTRAALTRSTLVDTRGRWIEILVP